MSGAAHPEPCLSSPRVPPGSQILRRCDVEASSGHTVVDPRPRGPRARHIAAYFRSPESSACIRGSSQPCRSNKRMSQNDEIIAAEHRTGRNCHTDLSLQLRSRSTLGGIVRRRRARVVTAMHTGRRRGRFRSSLQTPSLRDPSRLSTCLASRLARPKKLTEPSSRLRDILAGGCNPPEGEEWYLGPARSFLLSPSVSMAADIFPRHHCRNSPPSQPSPNKPAMSSSPLSSPSATTPTACCSTSMNLSCTPALLLPLTGVALAILPCS